MKNKKPQPFLLKNFRWVSLALSIICVVFVYFIPHGIMYPDHYIIRWISFVLIFFILPILIFSTLIAFTDKIKLSTGIAAVSILVVGPTFELFQDYREKMELDKYGVWTKSVVINRKHSVQKVGSWYWLIKCKYEVKGKYYETLYHDDISNIHPIGDTIKIIYSTQFPKIYALESEWKK